jgi:DNA-binding PadR family transcriptional regulator
MTDLILLATLLDGPKHGYQLKKQAGMIFGQGAIHNNLVYPLLRKFTNEGWVSKRTVPGERGQNKQQYSITAAGRRTLVERLSDFGNEAARSEDGFRIRVALLSTLPAETQENILTAREIALTGRDAQLAAIEKAMDLGLYPAEVVKFMREQAAGELAWIRRLRKVRNKGAKGRLL